MSSEKSAFLTANPKGENESWEEWGDNLAKKYKTPSDAPNLPFAPGYEKLPETWEEYGTQWKDHYNNNIAGKPIPTKIGPVLPALPTTNATGAEWAAWGEAVGKAWSGYFAERGINLAETVKGLEYPKEPTDNNWAAYAAQWSAYGDKVGERLKAALAAKESA